MSFCVKCGSKLGDNEMFCGNCGQPVEGSPSKAAVSLNGKKAFADYFKYPVSTIKNLSNSLDVKSTIIIFAILVLLTAYIPFKPIKSAASALTSGLAMFGSDIGDTIKSKINGLYFTFLFLAIIFFITGTLFILVYGAIRSKKESFISSLNLFVLCSIPAVLTMVLSALIFGANSFSMVLMIFGLALSGILLYSQFKETLTLSDLDSFIAFVLVNVISYSVTFYIAYSIIKAQLAALEKML
jgi:hypothetical protein